MLRPRPTTRSPVRSEARTSHHHVSPCASSSVSGTRAPRPSWHSWRGRATRGHGGRSGRCRPVHQPCDLVFAGAGCGNRTRDHMITRRSRAVRPVPVRVASCRRAGLTRGRRPPRDRWCQPYSARSWTIRGHSRRCGPAPIPGRTRRFTRRLLRCASVAGARPGCGRLDGSVVGRSWRGGLRRDGQRTRGRVVVEERQGDRGPESGEDDGGSWPVRLERAWS